MYQEELFRQIAEKKSKREIDLQKKQIEEQQQKIDMLNKQKRIEEEKLKGRALVYIFMI